MPHNDANFGIGPLVGRGAHLLAMLAARTTLARRAAGAGDRLVHDPADSARTTPALCTAAEAAVDLAGGARRTFGTECRPHIVIGQHVARADDHGSPAFQPV